MTLIFDIVKNGRNIPSKRNFHFNEDGGTIGRKDNNSWVLTDPNSYISGTHVSILCKHGTYFIRDESTNGTFLKNPYKKLLKNHPHKINASDVFIIGDHELQARYSNNDYDQDDLINSSKQNDPMDTIIPNDDFLFNSVSSDFTSTDSQEPSNMDIISILETESEQSSSGLQSEEPLIDEDVEHNVRIPDNFEIDGIVNVSEESEDENSRKMGENIFEEYLHVPSYTSPKHEAKSMQEVPNIEQYSGLKNSVAILEEKLGIDIERLSQEERDSLMGELGDIIINTLNALQNTLQIKDKVQQDLHLSTNYRDENDNNPVKLGAAAAKLLQEKNKSNMLGMMSISEGILSAFQDIDSHSIALHSSSKNIMKIAASKFSPKNLEYKFESTGALRGVLPKQQLLWKAYVDMFESLNDRPEDGVEMIKEDFKKEYEHISYSLKLAETKTRKRV